MLEFKNQYNFIIIYFSDYFLIIVELLILLLYFDINEKYNYFLKIINNNEFFNYYIKVKFS